MNLDIFQELEQELAHEGRTYAVSYLNKKEVGSSTLPYQINS